MEITLSIPQNDYVQPTEARQEVVQIICNKFLDGMEFRFNDSNDRRLYIDTLCGGHKYVTDGKTDTQIRGVEMQAAFDALLKAGYHLCGWYNITSGVHTYACSKTPYYKGMKCNLTQFRLFID